MLSRRKLLGLAAAIASSALLSSCGLRKVEVEGEEQTATEAATFDVAGLGLTVAVATETNSEILREYCRPLLEDLGMVLETKIYTLPERANADCERGRVDCTFLQSKAEINRYLKQHEDSELTPIAAICYQPFGVYSNVRDTLREAPIGATVALPSDLAGQGHALQVLSQERMVTLTNPGSVAASLKDVVENPRELAFEAMPADELVEALDDFDYAVIPPEVAFEAGLAATDAVVIESNENIAAQWYASALIATDDKAQDVRIQALLGTLRSPGLAAFLRDRHGLDVLQIAVDGA